MTMLLLKDVEVKVIPKTNLASVILHYTNFITNHY